jgi:hypothetical protein
MREAVEEAFWNFVDQKWIDALNIAVAEPAGWGTGGRRSTAHESEKRGATEAKKLAQAAVHVTEADGKRQRQGDGGMRCIFAGAMGCSGQHPPWNCRIFESMQAKEREKVDNQLCPFCLLHDRTKTCGTKEKQTNPACNAPGCKGKRIRKLHEFLKDIHAEEGRVHLVQENEEWEMPGDEWTVDREGEAMIMGTIQQEDDSSWQEVDSSWMELDEKEGSEDYCVGTCQGAGKQTPEAGNRCPGGGPFSPEEEKGEEDEEFVRDGWWTPDLRELQVKEEEKEYVIELLMGGSMQDGAGPTPETEPSVGGMADQSGSKGMRLEPGAQRRDSGKARSGGLSTSKEKGEKGKESPSGKGKPSNEIGAEDAGGRGEPGLRGWQPNCKGREESPESSTGPGPGRRSSTSTKPAGTLEHKRGDDDIARGVFRTKRSRNRNIVLVQRRVDLGWGEFVIGWGREGDEEGEVSLRATWAASRQKEGFQVSKGEQREVNGEWQGEQNRELRYNMCHELYMYMCI